MTISNAASQSKTINPFWVRSSQNDRRSKKALKISFKWGKILIYLFLAVVGLWGCFQTFFDYSVATSTGVGEGLEIAYNWGVTGDWAFDAMSSPNGASYFIFSDFTMNYGPFYAWFVWPASKLVLGMMWTMRGLPGGLNTVFSILILLLIIRAITIAVSLRTTLQSERMSEIQAKVAVVNAKYKGLNDSLSKQRKQMETMAIYKKNNFRPFASIEQIFVTLPIFLIVYRIVSATRPIKATILFNIWDLSKQPFSMVFSNINNGGAWFILFLALLLPIQILQTKIPMILSRKRNRNQSAMSQQAKEQYKKTMRFQWIFTIGFAAITAFSPAGVGLYYFFNSVVIILQSYFIHVYTLKHRERQKLRLEDIKIEQISTT